jgi:hypothetical protein
MTLTKKLFNKQPSIFEYNTKAYPQDQTLTPTESNSFSNDRALKALDKNNYSKTNKYTLKAKKASNQEILGKVEKLNAHIEELSFLLSLSSPIKHLDILLTRVSEIKKQAKIFDIAKLINLDQLKEIEDNILIIQRSST